MNTGNEATSIAELYRELGSLLRGIMQSRFGIPAEDAKGLLHDIFAALIHAGSDVENPERWLIGAACNASRHYWRQTREQRPPEPDDLASEPSVEQGVALAQILDRLPDRAGEVLRLKYLEGLSNDEIAAGYGTTVEYAHVLIHRSLEKARALVREKGDQRPRPPRS